MKTAQAPWQKLGYKLKLGLRSCTEEDWLPLEDPFGDDMARSRQIRLKTTLSEKQYEDVFSALSATESASAEVLAMICSYLQTFHSSRSIRPDKHLHPLDAAARLIPEDLLVLAPRPVDSDERERNSEWHLVAASVCFPAHWVLAEKMNRPLSNIHEPVPHYKERLETPLDRFFTYMEVGIISTRMNWSLQFGNTLFVPHREARLPAQGQEAIQQIFVRMERQTLRKLPQTGHILFTIRTSLVPVMAWKNTPHAIADLVTMMDEMSPATRAYKGVDLYQDTLRQQINTAT